MERLRPNGQRAKIALTLVWIVFGLEILALFSGIFQYNLLQKAANGELVTSQMANANDIRQQVIGIIYLVAFIVSGIVFINWFRRAYYNLHLSTTHVSHSEGWAAGAWFVPIINLYRPYQIMKELYTKTSELIEERGVSFYGDLNVGALNIWWTLWIISGIMGQIEFRYTRHANTIEEISISTIISIIGNVLGVVLALITIKVIKEYSNAETVLAESTDDASMESPQWGMESGEPII